MPWIDTHCHLDAPELDPDRLVVRQAARDAGVALCVYPAVCADNWQAVRDLAHNTGDAYALGIHPLYVPEAREDDLQALQDALQDAKTDGRCVAVGEIGLDFFEPHLCTPEMRGKQWRFYTAQLALAQALQLPVILHVRRSVDLVLKGLRQCKAGSQPPGFAHGGIAHAFNGSWQQAMAFVERGFALGFGGAVTFERALQLRRLAKDLPAGHLVLETDTPDIPPHWLYQHAQARAAGAAQGRNTPAELPGIAQVLADLRGITPDTLQAQSSAAALAALPRCQPFFFTFGPPLGMSKRNTPAALPEVHFSEDHKCRHLHLGQTPWVQGSMWIDKPFDIELEYVQRMMAWLLFTPAQQVKGAHAMQLGLGAGTLTKFCLKKLGMTCTVAELNPAVLHACRGWFHLPADGPRLKVMIQDAQAALQDEQWWGHVDALQVDLYDQEAAAPVLDSPDFYTDCRRVLSDNACMTVNLFGRHAQFDHSVANIAAAFGEEAVWLFKPTREGNAVVLAQRTPSRPKREALQARAAEIEALHGLPAGKWLRVFKPLVKV